MSPWWEGKSEDEIQAYLAEIQAYLAEVRARLEAQHVAELEATLAATTEEFSWPPMPNTAHPSFERQARFVRELMDRGRNTILLAVEQPMFRRLVMDPSVEVMAEAHRQTMLQVERAVTSLAPWTERPYVYMWRVAVESSTNRWVAGNSWVEHPPPGWTPPRRSR